MIIVVSGLPRSGTSMMMKMLEAANIPILSDGVRKPDDDNFEGYYEDERVKTLHEDNSWIPEAEGKAVKVISYLLPNLPNNHEYTIIFMERQIEEILASQKKMMERRGESQDNVPDAVMQNLFRKHLEDIKKFLETQPNMKAVRISYNDTVKDPEATARILAKFLEKELDIEAMTNAVNPNLYRQRVEKNIIHKS